MSTKQQSEDEKNLNSAPTGNQDQLPPFVEDPSLIAVSADQRTETSSEADASSLACSSSGIFTSVELQRDDDEEITVCEEQQEFPRARIPIRRRLSKQQLDNQVENVERYVESQNRRFERFRRQMENKYKHKRDQIFAADMAGDMRSWILERQRFSPTAILTVETKKYGNLYLENLDDVQIFIENKLYLNYTIALTYMQNLRDSVSGIANAQLKESRTRLNQIDAILTNQKPLGYDIRRRFEQRAKTMYENTRYKFSDWREENTWFPQLKLLLALLFITLPVFLFSLVSGSLGLFIGGIVLVLYGLYTRYVELKQCVKKMIAFAALLASLVAAAFGLVWVYKRIFAERKEKGPDFKSEALSGTAKAGIGAIGLAICALIPWIGWKNSENMSRHASRFGSVVTSVPDMIAVVKHWIAGFDSSYRPKTKVWYIRKDGEVFYIEGVLQTLNASSMIAEGFKTVGLRDIGGHYVPEILLNFEALKSFTVMDVIYTEDVPANQKFPSFNKNKCGIYPCDDTIVAHRAHLAYWRGAYELVAHDTRKLVSTLRRDDMVNSLLSDYQRAQILPDVEIAKVQAQNRSFADKNSRKHIVNLTTSHSVAPPATAPIASSSAPTTSTKTPALPVPKTFNPVPFVAATSGARAPGDTSGLGSTPSSPVRSPDWQNKASVDKLAKLSKLPTKEVKQIVQNPHNTIYPSKPRKPVQLKGTPISIKGKEKVKEKEKEKEKEDKEDKEEFKSEMKFPALTQVLVENYCKSRDPKDLENLNEYTDWSMHGLTALGYCHSPEEGWDPLDHGFVILNPRVYRHNELMAYDDETLAPECIEPGRELGFFPKETLLTKEVLASYGLKANFQKWEYADSRWCVCTSLSQTNPECRHWCRTFGKFKFIDESKNVPHKKIDKNGLPLNEDYFGHKGEGWTCLVVNTKYIHNCSEFKAVIKAYMEAHTLCVCDPMTENAQWTIYEAEAFIAIAKALNYPFPRHWMDSGSPGVAQISSWDTLVKYCDEFREELDHAGLYLQRLCFNEWIKTLNNKGEMDDIRLDCWAVDLAAHTLAARVGGGVFALTEFTFGVFSEYVSVLAGHSEGLSVLSIGHTGVHHYDVDDEDKTLYVTPYLLAQAKTIQLHTQAKHRDEHMWSKVYEYLDWMVRSREKVEAELSFEPIDETMLNAEHVEAAGSSLNLLIEKVEPLVADLDSPKEEEFQHEGAFDGLQEWGTELGRKCAESCNGYGARLYAQIVKFKILTVCVILILISVVLYYAYNQYKKSGYKPESMRLVYGDNSEYNFQKDDIVWSKSSEKQIYVAPGQSTEEILAALYEKADIPRTDDLYVNRTTSRGERRLIPLRVEEYTTEAYKKVETRVQWNRIQRDAAEKQKKNARKYAQKRFKDRRNKNDSLQIDLGKHVEEIASMVEAESDRTKVQHEVEYSDDEEEYIEQCIHVDTCPLKLPCSAIGACNQSCGGHYCTHFQGCKPPGMEMPVTQVPWVDPQEKQDSFFSRITSVFSKGTEKEKENFTSEAYGDPAYRPEAQWWSVTSGVRYTRVGTLNDSGRSAAVNLFRIGNAIVGCDHYQQGGWVNGKPATIQSAYDSGKANVTGIRNLKGSREYGGLDIMTFDLPRSGMSIPEVPIEYVKPGIYKVLIFTQKPDVPSQVATCGPTDAEVAADGHIYYKSPHFEGMCGSLIALSRDSGRLAFIGFHIGAWTGTHDKCKAVHFTEDLVRKIKANHSESTPELSAWRGVLNMPGGLPSSLRASSIANVGWGSSPRQSEHP